MEEERVKLPIYLGLEISKILKEKHGIEPHKDAQGMLDCTFTKEELALITRLRFENPTRGILNGISNLPNLKSLEVVSKQITAYTHPKDITSIGEEDIIEISKCKDLENLTIVNQANIDFIDVSDLTNLSFLTLSDNTNLEQISGLENLQGLAYFECYGNKKLHKVENLDTFISQMPEMSVLKLDVLLFPDAIGYKHLSNSYNKEALSRIEDELSLDCSWLEGLNGRKGTGGNKNIKINTSQMIRMHKKACEILDDNIPKGAGPVDTIIAIEEYLSRNVKYNYDENRKPAHDVSENHIVKGPITGANGAYMAITENRAVCQGYTRAMQYLLKLEGIASHDVECIGIGDKVGMADNVNVSEYDSFIIPTDRYHSIICIDDYFGLYDDPCWNAARYQRGDKSMPWILKTHSEILKDHTLSFEERGISNNHLKVSPERINESRERYEYYRNNKDGTTKKDGKEVLQSAVKATEQNTRTGSIKDALANIENIERNHTQDKDLEEKSQEI